METKIGETWTTPEGTWEAVVDPDRGWRAKQIGKPENIENIWDWYLEDYPEIAFQGLLPQTGAPSFLDYWRKQYGKLWGEYQGRLGRQALAGQPPSLNWADFLKGYPWLQRYLGLSPEERGERAQQFAPRLRWQV